MVHRAKGHLWAARSQGRREGAVRRRWPGPRAGGFPPPRGYGTHGARGSLARINAETAIDGSRVGGKFSPHPPGRPEKTRASATGQRLCGSWARRKLGRNPSEMGRESRPEVRGQTWIGTAGRGHRPMVREIAPAKPRLESWPASNRNGGRLDLESAVRPGRKSVRQVRRGSCS